MICSLASFLAPRRGGILVDVVDGFLISFSMLKSETILVIGPPRAIESPSFLIFSPLALGGLPPDLDARLLLAMFVLLTVELNALLTPPLSPTLPFLAVVY